MLRGQQNYCQDLLHDNVRQNVSDITPKKLDVSSQRYQASRLSEPEADMESATLYELNSAFLANDTQKRHLENELASAIQNVERLKDIYRDCSAYSAVLRRKIRIRRTLIHASQQTNTVHPEVIKQIDEIPKGLQVEDLHISSDNEDEHKTDSVHDLGQHMIDENQELLLRTDDATLSFICAICNKSFGLKIDFQCHLDAHSGDKLHCDKCNEPRVFTNKRAFDKHRRWHKSGGLYINCKICGKTFEYTYRLDIHMRSHSQPSYFCTVVEHCERKFTIESELRKHELYGHYTVHSYS